jgi:CelD/BcsL family acetyltransferase involved in cellulose biosynthesis
VLNLQPPLLVEEVQSLDALRADWVRLAELDGDLFKTWEWARAWEDTYGAGGRVLLTFAREGEPLTGIARLSRIGPSSFGLFGFEGQGRTDQVGPICAPSDRAAVAAALRSAVATHRGRPGALLAHGLLREQGWTPLLHGVSIKNRPSPVLEFNGLDWSGWLATKSSNFRQQAHRLERRLIREHQLTYRQVTTEEQLTETMEHFIAFHDARWQGQSDFFESGGRALHTSFSRLALERGWLRLWTAELRGEPAACWLGYHYAGAYWFSQLARDPRWSRTSIGTVLLHHALRCALDEGAARFRFLSGAQGYKQRFANGDAGHETILVTGPLLSAVARMSIGTARRLPESVTKPVRSWWGR